MTMNAIPVAPAAGGIPRDTVEEIWDLTAVEEIIAGEAAVAGADFADGFTAHFGLDGVAVLTTSARTGLCEYLRARGARLNRDVVLIAAFNCAAVAEAVVAAGLVVATFDADPGFGAMTPVTVEPLLTTATLAVVVPHLFGVPCDLRPLLERCQRYGIAVIEDCSQTVGAALNGRVVGSYGDAAIFSFGYDKPLSLGGGGLLLVRDQTRVEAAIGDRDSDRRLLGQLCAFLRRRRELICQTGHVLDPQRRRALYADAANAPASAPIGPLRAALGLWQLTQYDEVVRQRNANAEFLTSAGIRTWQVPVDTRPAWLKQKVLLPDSARAATVTLELLQRGLRAGPFNWPTTIAQGGGDRQQPIAADYAARAIDVPIHQRMTRPQLAEMANTLAGAT